jgi:hypothetical protein
MRGHYGKALVVGRTYARAPDDQRPSIFEQPSDYGELGVGLGIGALVGILIGSNITFHTPVRRRR